MCFGSLPVVLKKYRWIHLVKDHRKRELFFVKLVVNEYHVQPDIVHGD